MSGSIISQISFINSSPIFISLSCNSSNLVAVKDPMALDQNTACKELPPQI
jgi:hypothetical protein